MTSVASARRARGRPLALREAVAADAAERDSPAPLQIEEHGHAASAAR
jgi:hypothetical protein